MADERREEGETPTLSPLGEPILARPLVGLLRLLKPPPKLTIDLNLNLSLKTRWIAVDL